jgi:hypothetical protein
MRKSSDQRANCDTLLTALAAMVIGALLWTVGGVGLAQSEIGADSSGKIPVISDGRTLPARPDHPNRLRYCWAGQSPCANIRP